MLGSLKSQEERSGTVRAVRGITHIVNFIDGGGGGGGGVEGQQKC